MIMEKGSEKSIRSYSLPSREEEISKGEGRRKGFGEGTKELLQSTNERRIY